MTNTNYAPVVIPTLCRFNHFVRCVESLSRCVGAKDTDLIIGLDYPLKESHQDGYQKICDYLRNGLEGFNKVEIIKRDYNFGAKKNIEDLISYVRSKYETYIISEDDNEFSPNFLIYINEGLNKYKDNERVCSISGYCYPVDMSECKTNVFPLNTYSAFGCGRWSKKHPNLDDKFIKGVLYSPAKLYKIYKERPLSLLNFANMILKKDMYGDVCFGIYLILNQRVSVFPKISKVRNHGYDGSGEHCGTKNADLFINQPFDNKDTFVYDEITLNEEKIEAIKEYLAISTKAKILTCVRIIEAQVVKLFS